MSEDESRRADHEEQQDEVEGHSKHLKAANEEASSELEDDDVEAHGHHLRNRPGRA